MTTTTASLPCATMLLGLLTLLAGCAHNSPRLPAVAIKAPRVPELPTSARQPVISPSYSARAASDIEQWRRQLMSIAPPASPASGPSTQ